MSERASTRGGGKRTASPRAVRRTTAPSEAPDANAPSEAQTSRGERRKRETRAKLLQAAFQLFAERGVDAVAINEITEAADVGFGSFYNHFTSKEALHDELTRQLFDEHGQQLDRLTKHLVDPAEVLAVSIRHTILRAQRAPLWGRFLMREGQERGLTQGLGPYLQRDLQRGIEAGRFACPDPLLSFILIGSGVLGALAAQLQFATGELPRGLSPAQAKRVDLPERTAAALLRTLGLEDADAVATRPLPPTDFEGAKP